jgi:hypothetical protein
MNTRPKLTALGSLRLPGGNEAFGFIPVGFRRREGARAYGEREYVGRFFDCWGWGVDAVDFD